MHFELQLRLKEKKKWKKKWKKPGKKNKKEKREKKKKEEKEIEQLATFFEIKPLEEMVFCRFYQIEEEGRNRRGEVEKGGEE